MDAPMSGEEIELIEKIRRIKHQMGGELVILGHHYQRREIVELSDYRGDSLQLSQRAAERKDAKYIVFCGVRFMAESAAILAGENQIVQHPDPTAGCPMADMADLEDVERAWTQITEICGQEVIPVVYVNSSADVKAFVGRWGGATCTSSNALKLFKWAYSQKEKLLFLPDQHLGINTANVMGIPRDERIVWDFTQPELGGNSEEDIKRAKLILWSGHCHVHTWFTVDHILKARRRYPDGKIVVHPECVEDVVNLADYNGSTAFIVRFVEEAPPGSTTVIGTEINLVSRLAYENPDKTVVELSRSLCPNMYKINLRNLLYTLEHPGEVNVVEISDEVKYYASLALNRMLEATVK